MSKRLTFAEYTKKQREEEEKKKELEVVYPNSSQKTKAVSTPSVALPTASNTAVSSDKGISFAEYTKRENQQQDKSVSLATPQTPTLSLEQQRYDAKARAEQAKKAQKELDEALSTGDRLTAGLQSFTSGPARFLGDLLSLNKGFEKVERIETKEDDNLFNLALAGAQKLFLDQAERSAKWGDALTDYADKAGSNPFNRRRDYFKQQQYEADTEAKLLDAKILEEDVKSKPDFELKSGYVEPELPYMSFAFTNKEEKTYAAINDVNQRGYMIGGDVDSRLAKMTPDEIKVYNYLYNTGDKKQLKAYLDMLMPRLEKETAETMRETQRKIGEEHPIAASIVSVPTQVFGDVVSAGENIKNVVTGEVNPYSAASVMSGMAQGMRGGVSSNIQQTVFDMVAADKMADGMSEEKAAAQGEFYAKAAAFFYSAGMSVLDSATRAAVAGALAGAGLPSGIAKNAGLVSMASGVFQRTATEAKLDGATDSQAIALGIVYGGAEYLTERVELNTLMDRWLAEGADAALDAAGNATGKEARKLIRQANFKYWLQNVYCEGREETISGIISSVGNIIIMGDQSEWTQAINAYMADGKDRQEAVKLAVFDKIKELGGEFVAGALSGGVMSGGAVAANAATNAIVDLQTQTYRDATAKTAQQVSEQIQRETAAATAQVQAETAAETAAQVQPTVDIGEAQEAQNQTAQAQAEVQPEIEVQPIDVEQAVKQADKTVAYDTATALNNEVYSEWYNNLTTDSQSRVSQLRDTASQHGMNEHTTRQLEFLSVALGGSFEVVRLPSEVGEDGTRYARNGYYRDGTLYINADTQEAIPFVAAHEMTHSMEGTDAYDKYRNYVLNHFKKSGSYEQLRNEITNLYEQAGVNNVDIDGEIVAEFAGRHLFTDLNAITAMKNYDHSLVSRIRSWLSDMVTKLKGTPEQRTAAFFNRALDLYSRALQQSNRNVLPGTKTAETAQTAQTETGKIILPRADAGTEKAMEITDAYYDALSDDATSEEVWEAAKKRYGIDTEYSISRELDEKYPGWNDNSTTATGRDNTQIAGTVSSYKNIGSYLLKTNKNVKILDASSGLGLGTETLRNMGFDIQDVEPFPGTARTAPDFINYDDIPSESYDVVISNAVLNVIPDDWRNGVVQNMARVTKPGGKLIVSVRDAREIEKTPNKIPLENEREVLIMQNGKPRHYQKGFTQRELENYLKTQLGNGWTVEKATENNTGLKSARAAVATKIKGVAKPAEGDITGAGDAQYSISRAKDAADANSENENNADTEKKFTNANQFSISADDDKRFIDRQDPNFADTITKEAEKLGIIEKVGKRTINKQAEAEVKAQKEKILASAETKAGKILEKADARAKGKVARADTKAEKILEKADARAEGKVARADTKAEKILEKADARAEGKVARADTKAEKVLSTSKANADQRYNKAKEAADAIVNQAVQYREMKRNEVQKIAKESMQRLLTNLKDKAESRKEARNDVKIRRANLDIVLPTSVDEALKMYDDLYKSEQVYKETERINRLNENDARLVSLLFRGDVSVMDVYEMGKESEKILQVFATLKEFDRLARTAKEWRKAVQGEYNAEADGYLEDLVEWKDHNMAMTYHKQPALRNFRDATKESPETTAKFEALEAEKRKANADMRTWRDSYADRARKLNISAKAIDLKSGNKMSEGEFIVRYSDLEQAIAKAEKEVSKRYGKHSQTVESAQLHYNQMVFNLETARRLGNAQSIAEAESEVKKAWEMLEAAKADFGIEDDVKIDGRSYSDLTREMENLVNDWNNTLHEHSDEGTWQYGDELTDNAAIAKSKLDALVEIYKELAVELNKAYVANGYAPMGIIDRYTPVDFTDSSSMLNKIGRRLGIHVQNNELPTQIAGLTHSFTPGVTWFGNKLKRHTYFSKEMNPLETLDRYLTNAGNVIFLTEHIQKLRALERQLRYKTGDEAYQKQFDAIWNNDGIDIGEKMERIDELVRNDAFAMNNFIRWLHEYTNQLAGKKSLFDRPFEEFGRNKMYKMAQALDKAIGIGLVAGNIASAPTNLIPIAQVTAVAGTQNTARALAKTMEQQTRNLFGNERDEIWTASDFLKTRKSMEPIHKDRYDHIHDVGGFLFTACDSFAAEVVVRACYMHNIQQGMGEEAALRMADMQAGSVMADRSKGQLPTWFGAQNILSRTINKFQLEVANTVDFFLKDIKYYNKERDKTILGVMAFIFWSWMMNQGLEMLTGRKPAQEPVSVINDTAGAMTGYKLPNVGDYVLSGFDSEQFKTKKQSGLGVAKTFIEGLISQLPYQSAIQIALDAAGVDNNISGGRIPMASAVPNFVRVGGALFGKNSDKFSAAEKAEVALEELSRAALILPLTVPFGIGANQIRKTTQGAATMLAGGSYKINSKGDKVLQYPVDRNNPLNWLKAMTLGKSSLSTARKWVDSDFDTLTAKETASYKAIVDLNGYNAALSALDAMEAVSKAGKIEEKINVLNDSSLDSTAKIIIYRNNVIQDGGNEQALIDKLNGNADMGILYDALTAIRAEEKTAYKIQRLLSSGLDGNSRAAIYRELLTGKGDKDGALMDEFKGKVDAGSLADALMNVRIAADTPAKITAIQNSWISDDAKKRIFEVKISDSRADEMAAFKSAGLSLDDFFKSYAQYNNIYRSEEKPSVKAQEFSDWLNRQEYSDDQKAVIKDNLVYFNMAPATAGSYDKLYDAGLTADQSRSLTERLNALEPLPGEETVRNRQKWDVIVSEGLTVDEQLRAIRAHSYDTEYYRFKISNDYKVAPTDYLKFLDLLPAFDADGNGSMKQSEVQAALDSLGGRTGQLVLSRPGDNKLKLTNEQKAVLWQVYTNGKDGKNNPYSTTTGKKVYDAMQALKDAAKAEDEGEAAEEKKPFAGIVLPRP